MILNPNPDKPKKPRPHELGPLNITKSQYKPYFGSQPNKRNKQNLLSMGPLENIMFDIPPIEETQQPLQYSVVEKLRIKVGRFFQEKSVKSKEQWDLYVRKAQIVEAGNAAWAEVETFLLKIIADLFYQLKCSMQASFEVQKQRQSTQQAENQLNTTKIIDQTKLDDKYSKILNQNSVLTTNINKIDCSVSDYSTLPRGNLTRSKILPKNQPKCSNNNNNEDGSIMQSVTGAEGNYQQLKVTKLEKEIALYKERIRNMEEESRVKLEKMEKKIQVELELKYSQTLQEKMKYENQVESKKFYGDILAQQFKNLKKKFFQLENENQKIKKQYLQLKTDKNQMNGLYQYKQMWWMQHQEILQLRQQIHNIKGEKEAEITKNKGLKQKLKELSKNFNYNYNVSMENQKDKQDLNKVLKDFRDWLKFFAVPRVSKGMMNNNTFFPEMALETGKENYESLLPKDDTTNYKLLRPNFFIYFEAYEGIIMTERKFPQRKVMPPSFYLTIRAILDAMYLHFSFVTDYKQWLSFPEFVISFLEKFQINSETRKPTLRKMPCQSEQKINFLLNVFNIEAANSWQCETFRNFIMEQFTLDELYFYLDCRDHLLRGSQLNNNFGSSDSITYVRVNIAEEIIKDRLRNYDRQMLERMKKFLNSKKKIKGSKELIDMNFVLKLLLQVYSIQKIKSQKFFHHNFKTKTPSAKISYTEYSAFMSKNFDFMTKCDIAKLYREIYTLGVSHITYKTVHYLCSMKGLFIPLLKTKLSTKLSIVNEPKYPKVFQDMLFLHLQNSLANMFGKIQEYGVEEFVDNTISVNKFLHDCENLKIHRSNFSYRLLQLTEKIIRIRSVLAQKNQKAIIYEELTKDQVRERLGYLLTITHQSDDDINALKKWRENRQKAMVKLVRNFKIRIQQSLAQFKIVDKKQYEMKISQMNQLCKNDEKQPKSEKDMDKNDQEDQIEKQEQEEEQNGDS